VPAVPCLRDEIAQALLNVIVNAAHAIGDTLRCGVKEKGRIEIRLSRRPEGQVEIRVSDDGCGIPQELQQRVFDPFFTTKPVGKGTGQGLAIVYSTVVDKHGGSLSLESEPGRGTSIALRLPLAIESPEEADGRPVR